MAAALGLIRRRLAVILLCALLVPLLAWVALQRTPRSYTASGTLIYDPGEYRARELQSVLRSDPTTEAVLGSQVAVLRGLDLVERVATALGLFSRPEFNAALRPPGWLDAARNMLRPSGEARPDPMSEPARNAALQQVQQVLQVKTSSTSRALEVSFTASDPVLAASVVNRLMDFYVRDQLAAKFRAVQRAQDWLERRAAELRREVRAGEERIARYRASEGMVSGMHAGLDAERISTITENLSRARSEMAQAEGRLDAARGGGAAEAAVAPSVVEAQQQEDMVAGQIRGLSERLGPNHPEMRALRRELAAAQAAVGAARARVVAATRAEVRAAQARVEMLEHDLAEAQARSETQSKAQTPLHEMERDLDASRTLLQSVLDRLQEIHQQAAAESADAREVSVALPPAEPSFPHTRPMLGAAAALGLALGLMAAYAAELADSTVKGAEDMRAHLRLRCLALVPRIGRRALRGALISEYAVTAPMSSFAEQIRSLRAGLWLGREQPRILAVAAARPGEGKSTITLSLARSAALSGERVLAIDCDMRRPSFGRLLGAQRDRGLADLLRGTAAIDDVLHGDHLSSLAFIPAGEGGAETLGLLMSEAMGRLLQSLRAEFDFILMDAPPAHAMADARVIAHLADATLLCVRWRATPRAVAHHALELLESAGAAVIGGVLTRVDARAHRRAGGVEAELADPRYRKYWRA